MVLADRTTENVRNGRRSRGPSPNGHAASAGGAATESSSDDENSRKNGNAKAAKVKSEYEEKIRVGRDYQAVCPELIPPTDRKLETLNDRALLVWSPTKDIPDIKLEEYITVAKDRYGYNGEQALGMLFWHKHDLERAVLDLANFTPFPDEWTAEDRVLFEQAFQFHGKSFHRIRQMLPDKSIASLVKFYYSWKKTRSRTSVMDRQEKVKKNDSSENGSDHGSNEDSDNDEKLPATGTGSGLTCNIINLVNGTASIETNDSKSSTNDKQNTASVNSFGTTGTGTSASTVANGSNTTLNCSGCGVTCSELNATSQGKLCGSCHHHWRRTGALRPTSGPAFMNKRSRGGNILGKSTDSHKRKPPKGMYINHDDIVKLANSAQNNSNEPNDDLLASMDREIISLLSQIQYNKQNVSGLKVKIEESFVALKPPEVSTARLNFRWNNEEILLAVQGVRKYGLDFQAIADALGTKTEAQVRTYLLNNRRRLNLDSVCKEFEAMINTKQQLQENTNNSSNYSSTIETNESLGTQDEGQSESKDGPIVCSNEEKQSTSRDSDVMEIDLIEDDNVLNGKSKDACDELVENVESTTPASSTPAANLPAVATASPIDDTPMDVDDVTITSSKVITADSDTVIIK